MGRGVTSEGGLPRDLPRSLPIVKITMGSVRCAVKLKGGLAAFSKRAHEPFAILSYVMWQRFRSPYRAEDFLFQCTETFDRIHTEIKIVYTILKNLVAV